MARDYLEKSLKIFKTKSNRRGVAEILETLSELYWVTGDYDEARQLYSNAKVICEEIGILLINPTSRNLVAKNEQVEYQSQASL